MKTLRSLILGVLTLVSIAVGARAQVQTAGTLYVDIDPTGTALGLLGSISNNGTSGGYFEPSSVALQNGSNDWPVVVAVGGGTKGIMFNGRSHLQHVTAFSSTVFFPAPASLTGTNPTCSVEVWCINPTLSDEEQLVAWGRTGGTNSLMAFGYGAGGGGAGGAVNRNAGPNLVAPFHGLAGPNLSWGTAHPKAGTWHHLVYTFDGPNRMNRLYADGQKVVEFSNTTDVVTWGFTNITIATAHGAGAINGQNNTARSALVIGRVRVHSGVLSDAQVVNNYQFEVGSYAASPTVLTSGPIHRYSFNIPPMADAVGVTVTDSVGTAHGLVQGFLGLNSASTDGKKLYLTGGPPGGANTPAYVDLPNGMVSSLSTSNAGPGKFTIEGWMNIECGFAWTPVFNFGTTTLGEQTGPTTTGTGYQGRNYINWGLNNVSRALMRFEVGVPSTNDVPTNAPTGTITPDFLMDNKDKVPYSLQHFAVTWDEASGDIFIYVNGIQATRVNVLPQKFNSIGDVNCWLGRSQWQGDNYMKGNYDEVRIYNRVLSPGEVASDYRYGPDIVLTNLGSLGALNSIQIQPLGNSNTWVGMAPQLQVLANYANDPGVDVTDAPGIAYSSSNTNVTTVNSNGLLRLISAGPATITATFGAQTANITITNVAPPTPALIHRYSFTGVFDYTDSIGGATGTANGTSIADGSGKLILDPSGQGYLSLPTTVLAGEDALSIEAWVNVNTAAANNMLWAFGDQNPLTGNGRYGLFLSTTANLRTALFDTDAGSGHEQNAQRNGNINGLVNQHLVGVYDPLLGKVALYFNGALAAQVNAITPLTTAISNTLSQIGRSLYAPDPYWNGSVDEFRIWHGALSQQQIAVSDAAGPNTVLTIPGGLLSVASSLPFSNTVVTVSQQANFTGNFASMAGVNLFNYGEAGVTASSDNPAVASVTSAGVVRANAQGVAHIVFSYAGFSATNTITIQSAAPVMQHRYNFNGDAVDSIGGANGTLNGGASFSGGKVVLNAGTGDYVSLPSGIIAGYFATTVEAYVDFGTNISGSWLYGFGDQNGTGNGRFYTYYTPHINNTSRAGITASDPGNTGEQNVTDNVENLDSKTNLHIVVITHPFLGFESLYINGQQRAINNNVTALLSSVSPNFAYIGKSLWDVGGVGGYPASQPYLNASVDEFRIYQGAVSNSQIALNAASGPNVIVTNPGALLAVRIVLNSNMVFNTDQLIQVLGDFTSVSNVNMLGYTNVTIASSDTVVITTNALQGSIHASGTGRATVTATIQGTNYNAVVNVTPSGGPFFALRHRYPFNGNANDVAGTAHGTLKGNATIAGGALILTGGANGVNYLDLPNGLVSQGMTNATFEIWARQDAVATWSRIMDFGNSNNGEDNPGGGVNYLFWTLADGQGNQRFAVTTNGPGAEAPQLVGLPTVNGQTNQYVVTYDTVNNVDVMYTNGVRVITSGNSTAGVGPQNTAPFAMSNFNDVNVWVGRSQYSADPSFNGAIFEFRIYEGAFNSNEVAARFAAGMDGADPIPSISVVSNTPASFTLTWPAYAIRYGLQSRTSLTSGSWTNYGPFVPVTTNGIRRITVAPTGQSLYFRLTD
jgi:hypothetical protein